LNLHCGESSYAHGFVGAAWLFSVCSGKQW